MLFKYDSSETEFPLDYQTPGSYSFTNVINFEGKIYVGNVKTVCCLPISLSRRGWDSIRDLLFIYVLVKRFRELESSPDIVAREIKIL